MKKRWIVIIAVLVLAVIGVGVFFAIGKSGAPETTASAEKQETVGTITVPDVAKIKVVFKGPAELEDNWDTLDYKNFQLYVSGTLRNASNQTAKFTRVNFFLDGKQAGTLWPPAVEGWILPPGATAKVAQGLVGFSETTKILEIRVDGFQIISTQTTMIPALTPTKPESKPTPTSTTEPTQLVYKKNPKTAGDTLTNFFILLDEGKYEEAIKMMYQNPPAEAFERMPTTWKNEISHGKKLISVKITEEGEGDLATLSGVIYFADDKDDKEIAFQDWKLRKVDERWWMSMD